MAVLKTTRPEFLKISAAAGGGLLISFKMGGIANAEAQASGGEEFEPNAWLTIGSDNIVTVRVASSEMGQGIMTGIAMLVAGNWRKHRHPRFLGSRSRSRCRCP